MKNKRNISILCAVTLSAALLIGGTLAYFYDKGEIKNPFSMAGNGGEDDKTGVDVEITEPGYDPESSKDMLPGDVIVKDPTIENLKGDSYIRFIVKLVEKNTDTVITDQARADKILSTLFYDVNRNKIDVDSKYSVADMAAMVGTDVLTPVNSEFVQDTTRSSNGLYYYNYTSNNGILTNAEKKTLFTHVVIPTDWTQEDTEALGNYDLIVQAEAIQAQNFANASEAFDTLDIEAAR